MKKRLQRSGWTILLLSFLAPAALAQPYLSDLSATAEDPLYTTYAAPLQRSSFVVDQGYQFRFFDRERGIVFKTAQAGNLSMAFKLNGKVHYFRKQMNTSPEVTASYPDLVTYHYQPYQGVQVQSTFQTYSSQIAVQQVAVTNNRDEAITLEAYPFFQHPQSIQAVSADSGRRYVTFQHREEADGWTRRHGVPHADSLANVFMVGAPADAFGVYGALGPLNEDPTLSRIARSPSRSYYVKESGTVRKQEGPLCQATPPEASMVVFHNGSRQEILTENAPQYQASGGNIPGDGTQQLELIHFEQPEVAPGDSFRVVFRCGEQQGTATRVVPEQTERVVTNLRLADSLYVPPPQELSFSLDNDRRGGFLTWNSVENAVYSIYRRTRRTPGRYDLIADSLEQVAYFESGLDPDSGYAYVVLARDTLSGRISSHSEADGVKAPPAPPSPSRFFADIYADTLNNRIYPQRKEVAAFQKTLRLAPGERKEMRIIRGVARVQQADSLLDAARALAKYDVSEAVQANEKLYRDAPSLKADDAARKMTYWSTLNLLRQSMLPAEGQLSHDYLVNAREPASGMNHAGQMMRESLSMLAYALLDPESAQQSQRAYVEHQHDDGYIPHRVGPYLRQTEPQDGERTSAAPWFSWINAEIYAETQDQAFLEDMYAAGADYYRWWTRERDADGDGLSEWGGAAALESTREGESVIWDQVSAPEAVEALDLNAMLVQEARALRTMAETLGRADSAAAWQQRAARRAQAVRSTFWSAEDAFFYHVDRADNNFSVRHSGDLRRPEIIGFLPLWAGIATKEQADALVDRMMDQNAFGRSSGVPSLSANDPSYNARGRWNGSVWLPWQYLVFQGLADYGYDEQAVKLAEQSTEQVMGHLRDLHTFWRRHSPDTDWAGPPQPYVGAGIVARMMIDAQAIRTGIEDGESIPPSTPPRLGNYPNPFRSVTKLTYRLAREGAVQLTVYDLLGRKVATLVDERQAAGAHAVVWRPDNLTSGVFLARLHTSDANVTKKIIRLR